MIYLDHAATSFPRPAPVLAAVRRWFEELGVSAERGDGDRCREVAREVREARAALGRMVGVPQERVAFTSGATEALNLALRGLLVPGDAVLTTATEHSSLARPLVHLREDLGITFDTIACDGEGRVDPADVERSLRAKRYRLLAFLHASNVTGAVHDASAFCAAARAVGTVTLLDASQSAGLLPLAVGADLVAASTHKGLFSPPALGFLAVRPGLELHGTKQGGTGSARALDRQPEAWPHAFEAGTPNSPAIVGLAAALRWLGTRGAELLANGITKVDALRAALAETGRVRFQSPSSGPRVPILSFTVAGLDPAEAGTLLAEADIHVRTGFHCAPWIHEALGTAASGTIRVSPGPEISEEGILAPLRALFG